MLQSSHCPTSTRSSVTEKCLSIGIISLRQTFDFVNLSDWILNLHEIFVSAQPHSSSGLVAAMTHRLPGVRQRTITDEWDNVCPNPESLIPWEILHAYIWVCEEVIIMTHNRICKVTRSGYWLLCREECKRSRSTAKLQATNFRGMPTFLTSEQKQHRHFITGICFVISRTDFQIVVSQKLLQSELKRESHATQTWHTIC